MKISAKALKLLMKWEGCQLKPYRDAAGLPTIGVGHLVHHNENFHGGITTAQALDLLVSDLERFERAVTDYAHVPLNQNQFDALVCFAFNIGVSAFRTSGVLRKLNIGAYDAVPAKMRLWTKAGGKECKGLVNRRENEIKLWKGEI